MVRPPDTGVKRDRLVRVRMAPHELAQLDRLRGPLTRSAWLRLPLAERAWDADPDPRRRWEQVPPETISRSL